MPVDERLRRRPAMPGSGRPTKSPVDGDRKRCARCEKWKPLAEFSPDRRNKCGRVARCKRCHNRTQTPNPLIRPIDHPRQRATKLTLSFIARSPLGKSGVFESFDPVEIFERDNWICHLCGEPVEPDGAHNDPGQATVDHVIAVALGGIHARGNVRIAHRHCNAITQQGHWMLRR